jgi:hypothetical protein
MIIDSPIISGSTAASGSLNQVGNITITGSLIVTGDITGNITGSATNAVSASFAATATSASYAANATSASYANNATSASYALNSTSASYAANATSASYAAAATSASYAANATSASFSATASYLSNYIPPFPYTGSADISGSLSVNGNITSTGTLTAQTLIVQTITSSVDFVTGSTHFGSIIDNTHQFTGSVTISGSLAVNGSSAILTNQTGAMSVATASYVANAQTASYVETAQTASFVQTAQTASFVQTAQTASFVQNAQTASYVLNAISASFAVSSSYALTATSASNALTASYLSGYVSPFPYTGSAIISGSLEVTGSTNIPSITGSLLGTASFANTSTSSSFATTASFALNVPVTASYANNAATASYWSGSIVNAATASFAETASFVTTAQTASFVQTAQTASYVETAQTASFVVTAQTASFVQTAQTASYVLNAVSSSFATSASNALTASYLSGYVSPFPFTGSAIISGSLIVTGSVAVSNLGGSGVRYLVADESGSITAQSASAALKSTQAFTSTAGQTTFSVTNGYSTGYVDVFINGSKLATAEFTDTSGTNIVLATGSFVNDIVEVVKYTPALGVTNNVLRQLTTFTASAGQTVFSASYTPGLLDIFYNGSRLSPSDFTANNGTYFTLATGSAANDILDVLVYSYQVGAFSGIGGVGTAAQVAYFDTTNSITGSPNFTISGSTMTVTGSLIVSGSGTFTNIGPAVFSGSLTSTAGFTGSFSGTATSASYALNADLLDGLDSTVFTLTSSFAAQTASFTAFTSSINTFSASILSYTSSINAKTSSFATTGSNTFEGIQTVNSNLIVTGSITAQTLVVQTITSSVDFVTGSTRFGSILGNTHVFSGSVTMNPGGLFVSSSGLVGIGTTSPSYVLDIAAGSNGSIFTPAARISTSTGGAGGATILQINHTANSVSGLQILQAGASGGNYTSINNTENSYMSFATSGSERIRITATGNVGINTLTPTTRLSLGGIYYADTVLTYISSETRQAFFNSYYTNVESLFPQYLDIGVYGQPDNTNGGGVIRFLTNSVTSGSSSIERMRITATGNVGIGISNPEQILDVRKATANGDTQFNFINSTSSPASNTSATSTIYLGFYDSGTGLANANKIVSGKEADYQSPSTAKSFLAFYTSNANVCAEKMRITSGGETQLSGDLKFNSANTVYNASGNLFVRSASTLSFGAGGVNSLVTIIGGGDMTIGSTSAAKYQVLNFVHSGNTLGAAIGLAYTAGQFITNAGAGDLIIGNATNKNILFGNTGAGTTEYARITSGGDLLINTTDVDAGIGGGVGSNQYSFPKSTEGPRISTTGTWYINFNTVGGAGIQRIIFRYAGSSAGSIGVSSGAVSYNTSFSDVNKKKNFEPWNESVLDSIKTINPQKFNFIDQEDGTKKIKGFIAQEMVDKFPEAYIKPNDEFYEFNPSGMVVYLMKAIQEQQTLITALQEKLERNNII